MEGIVSVVIGLLVLVLLPDTPSLSTRWLNPGEIRFLNLIHQATRGSKRDELVRTDNKSVKRRRWGTFIQVISDPKIYLQAIVYMSNSVPNFALKFTMPQIVRNMGFTSTNAQLLTAPPYFAGAFASIFFAAFADRSKYRFPFIIGPQCLAVIGYAVLFVKADKIESNVAVCYVMVVFACMGIYPIIPGVTAHCINNLAGAEKRNIGTGFLVCHSSSIAVINGLPPSPLPLPIGPFVPEKSASPFPHRSCLPCEAC
jgi:MFS family permease